MDTTKLPDLPGLERIETAQLAHIRVYSVSVLITLVLIGLLIGVSILGLVDSFDPSLLVGVVVAAVAAIWLVVRLLYGDYSWKTNEHGLTCRSIARKRLLPWSSIRSARAVTSVTGTPYYRVESDASQVFVELSTSTSPLAASIWQHLRRSENTETLDFPEAAASFWDTIPDSVPRELDWTPRNPGILADYIFIGLTAAALVVTWALLYRDRDIAMITIMCIISPQWLLIVLTIARDARRRVRYIRVADDCIEARVASGLIRIDWEDVTSLTNRKQFAGIGLLLQIWAQKKRSVLLYCNWTDEGFAKLYLAMVRRLRERCNPLLVPVPDVLHQTALQWPADNELESDECVTVTLTRFEKSASALLFGMLAGCVLFLPPLDQLSLPFRLSASTLVFVAVYVLAGSYRIKADYVGITRHFAWRTSSLPWSDIASISIAEVGLNPWEVIFRDSKGRRLDSTRCGIGSSADRKRYDRFVRSKVAHLLAAADQDAPWKTKPWTPEQAN